MAAMHLVGLSDPTPASAADFRLAPAPAAKPSVVVLGAGIAGLISAYELQRAGYSVTVLEARHRAGGRAWTIRGGDRVEHFERPAQVASFSKGQYFNAGPARMPSWHRVMLGYAKALGVPMETFVNVNRNAGWDFGGKVQAERRMVNDMRGHIGELLAKAIDLKALDGVVSADELATVRQFLAPYAGVDGKGVYTPGGSSGFAVEPGGYQNVAEPLPPLPFAELYPSGAVTLPYLFEHIWDMQATMLQPVGGIDRIAYAIYEQVKPRVRLGTPITAIRRAGDRVRIEHGSGSTEADFCICTLPLTVLNRLPNDFSAAKKAAIASAPPYLHSVKVAFESRRFWEDDHIYGGLAWTDRLNENVLYPSSGFNQDKGVLVAAYVAGWTRPENPDAFQKLSHEQRFQICRESIEALHPGKAHLLAKGVTVAWGLTPYSEGVSPEWPGLDGQGPRPALYAELLKPEGRIIFAGEHLSYQPAWQEGAALSAHEALKLLASMAAESASRKAA